MTMNPQAKATMYAASTLSDSSASQGARRATGDADESARPAGPPEAHMEVLARAVRRQFSNADKRRILEAADGCSRPGEIGALLRREGVYSSSLSTWRRQREAAALAALAPAKRGPKPDAALADARRIAELGRDNERLRDKLERAQLVIEVQKKVAALLDSMTDDRPAST